MSYLLYKHSPISKNVLIIVKRCSGSSSSGSSHYEVLRISKSASHSQIKEAYIALCKEFHPDKNPSPDANLRFRAINEAYNTLGNRLKKQKYDRSLSSKTHFRNDSSRPTSEDARFHNQSYHQDPRFGKREPEDHDDLHGFRSHFRYQNNPKDPLNVKSEQYQKWEKWFLTNFPSKKKPLKSISSEKRVTLNGPQMFAIFCLIQAVVIKLVFYPDSSRLPEMHSDHNNPPTS